MSVSKLTIMNSIMQLHLLCLQHLNKADFLSTLNLIAHRREGGGGGGAHHHIISCYSEIYSARATKLCGLLFLPYCHFVLEFLEACPPAQLLKLFFKQEKLEAWKFPFC